MSPLFACAGCGVRIERSMRLYLGQKGHVLCSTCKDKLEADPPASAAPSDLRSQPPSG